MEQVGAKDAELGNPTKDAKGDSDLGEITSSAIVPSGESGVDSPRSRRSSYRALTPYQARLDVEMDDTAVSKVRDPSVSLRLSRQETVPVPEHSRARGPLASLALGTAGGVLVVLFVALLIRACAG